MSLLKEEAESNSETSYEEDHAEVKIYNKKFQNLIYTSTDVS